MPLPFAASPLPAPPGRRIAPWPIAMTLAMLASGSQTTFAQGPWTIQTADPGYSSGWTTSLRLDASGQPRVAEWMPGAGIRYAVYNGSSWTVETLPPPPTGSLKMDPADARGMAPPHHRAESVPERTMLMITTATALALDPQGDPWIAYVMTDQHNSVAPSRPVHASHKSGGVSSTEDLELGVFTPSVDVDGLGRVHVCYMMGTPANHVLRYALRDGGTWIYETVDANGGTAQLRVDAQGVPHIVYLDEARGVLVHAVRAGATWDTTTVPSPNQPAGFSFALDPSGQARVIVADYAVNFQTTLQYLEQHGSSWLNSTADPTTSLKGSLGLAFDPAGNPVVSYNDQNGLDLRVATRQGGLWTSQIVDAQGNTGYYTSVAVHPTGYPIVTYQNADGGGVMLVAFGSTMVGVAPGSPPGAFRLAGPHPNPVRVGAPLALSVELPAAAGVRLKVYDVSGRLVASRPPEVMGAGRNPVSWNPGVHGPGVCLLRAITSARASVTKRFAAVR